MALKLYGHAQTWQGEGKGMGPGNLMVGLPCDTFVQDSAWLAGLCVGSESTALSRNAFVPDTCT